MAVEVPSGDLEEEVQQFGSVCTVACVEEKAPVNVVSRLEILLDEDEELEFEAPPSLKMRKTAAPLARKYSVCSVTQKTKKLKLERTVGSGAEQSVWPIFHAQGDSDAEDRGNDKRFVAAVRKWATTGHREVKFGDAGDAKMLSFEVTDVTKPPVAVRPVIEKGNEAHFGAENLIPTAKGGKIPMRAGLT